MTPDKLHHLVVIHGQCKDDPFDIEQLKLFNIMKLIYIKKKLKVFEGLDL
jgi:hypothetical protein